MNIKKCKLCIMNNFEQKIVTNEEKRAPIS